MSLRSQIAILLTGLSMAFAAATYAVQVLVVMPAFAKLEHQGAERDIDRCVDGLGRDLELLSRLALDWSAWDETYQFVEDRNEEFRESTLNEEAFEHAHVNFLCLLNSEQKIVWGEVRDIETLEPIDAPFLLNVVQFANPEINVFNSVDDAHAGLLPTKNGPLLFASRPIVTSKNEGPIRGTMIMGRFLNSGEISGLADRTHIDLQIWPLSGNEVPQDAAATLASVPTAGEKFVQPRDAGMLHAYTVVNDLFDRPCLLIRANVPREMTAQGSVAAYVATGCGIAGGFLTLLVMGVVLQRRIVGPLQQLADHAVRVGRQDDMKARLNFKRTDEIGTLADEFDSMVQNLSDSRKKVLDSAHRAGMAEIASEVLHNVGNTVNSANCSIEMLEDRFAKSRLSGLAKATALLQEQAPHAAEFFTQDPRGPKLISYLVSLSETLHQERVDNQAEVTRLRETIRHIRDAISAQQVFAGRSDFRQDVELSGLIETVLGMNQELVRASETKVTVELPPLPELQLNKSKMIQVLVNLVRNAIQSMQEVPSDQRHLKIAASCVDVDGIEIEVADTGAGFSDQLRTKLFTHGFTTKPEGNGFGLHYCANAIREVGGDVTAQSAGPGRGASFRIRLPSVRSAAVNAVL